MQGGDRWCHRRLCWKETHGLLCMKVSIEINLMTFFAFSPVATPTVEMCRMWSEVQEGSSGPDALPVQKLLGVVL